jgi:hypothetical protein
MHDGSSHGLRSERLAYSCFDDLPGVSGHLRAVDDVLETQPK